MLPPPPTPFLPHSPNASEEERPSKMRGCAKSLVTLIERANYFFLIRGIYKGIIDMLGRNLERFTWLLNLYNLQAHFAGSTHKTDWDKADQCFCKSTLNENVSLGFEPMPSTSDTFRSSSCYGSMYGPVRMGPFITKFPVFMRCPSISVRGEIRGACVHLSPAFGWNWNLTQQTMQPNRKCLSGVIYCQWRAHV